MPGLIGDGHGCGGFASSRETMPSHARGGNICLGKDFEVNTMEDVCLDRMNAFVKSNIRLYLGMSAWHRPLHFVREQMLISRERKKNNSPLCV